MHRHFYYHDHWAKKDENGVSDIDRALQALVELEREVEGRDPHTTMLIVDSKSIQNADTAEAKGYDAGKKVELNFISALIFLVYHIP